MESSARRDEPRWKRDSAVSSIDGGRSGPVLPTSRLSPSTSWCRPTARSTWSRSTWMAASRDRGGPSFWGEKKASSRSSTSTRRVSEAVVAGVQSEAVIGRRVSRYVVTALLGKGGMGAVYRARDTELDRDVALKLIPT